MRKTKKMLLIMCVILGVTMLAGSTHKKVSAEEKKIEWKQHTLATYDDQGRMVYQPFGSAALDASGLEYLLNNNSTKTLVIPSGTKLTIDQVVDIGDNTTIIATGATITQIYNGVGVLKHYVDGANYNSLKNVTLIGGTWKNSKNSKECTMMRFVHASNIILDGVTVETNYQSHAVELIACKNVKINNCKLVAKNNKTKKKSSREEALQIDLATPLTAPGVLTETGKKKYVAGQVCQNITITNSTVTGSRGICANFASRENKYLNRFQKNITITGCKVTGNSAEGIALFNAVGCNIKNNTVKTYSKYTSVPYSDAIHLILMGKSSISTKYKNVITGNKAYGKYFGIEVTSKKGCKYGKTTVKNNKVYSTKGKSRCVFVKFCKKSVVGKNKCKKW